MKCIERRLSIILLLLILAHPCLAQEKRVHWSTIGNPGHKDVSQYGQVKSLTGDISSGYVTSISEPTVLTFYGGPGQDPILTVDLKARKIATGKNVEIDAAARAILKSMEAYLPRPCEGKQ